MPSIFGALVWAIATKQKKTYGNLPYRISQQSITHRRLSTKVSTYLLSLIHFQSSKLAHHIDFQKQ